MKYPGCMICDFALHCQCKLYTIVPIFLSSSANCLLCNKSVIQATKQAGRKFGNWKMWHMKLLGKQIRYLCLNFVLDP